MGFNDLFTLIGKLALGKIIGDNFSVTGNFKTIKESVQQDYTQVSLAFKKQFIKTIFVVASIVSPQKVKQKLLIINIFTIAIIAYLEIQNKTENVA